MMGGLKMVNEQPKLDTIDMGSSSYGSDIPLVWGTARLPANLVFAGKITTTRVESKQAPAGGKGGGGGITNVSYAYACTLAYIPCAGPVVGVRKMWGAGQLIYDASGDTLQGHGIDSITVHLGSEEQGRDASLEAELGEAATPGYQGRCMIVMRQYDMTELFSNRPPSLQVEVCERASVIGTRIDPHDVAVAEILLDVCERAGIDNAHVDVSGLVQAVRGWWLKGSYRPALEAIGAAFGVKMRDDAGTLRFYETDTLEIVARIPAAHLGARSVEGAPGEPGDVLPVEDADEQSLPAKLTVTYLDADRDALSSSQTVMRTAVASTNEASEDYEALMDATTARRIAERSLYRQWVESRTYGPIHLSRRYLGLRPGHVVEIVDDMGEVHTLRLTRVLIGADWMLEVHGVAHEGSVAVSTVDGESTDYTVGVVTDPGSTTAHLLDLPPLQDADAGRAGLYLAASGASPAWRQAMLYTSVDGGANWDAVTVLSVYSIVGACTTVLGVPAVDVAAARFDQVNTVQVQILRGELSGVSDAQLLADANLALIGNEIVQFGHCTLDAPRTYTLSWLLRGRLATEAAMATHVPGERFVLLSGLAFAELPTSAVGQPRLYRVVPFGGDITAEADMAVTCTGATLRPWAPIALRGTRDGAGSLSVAWTRRSRIGTELPDSGSDTALDEPVEAWQMQILAGGNVVRTLTSSTAAATYSAADQAADFGAVQPSISLRVAQVSSLVGPGSYAVATL